jgi:N-acetylglucosaminyldiphosphoundecaprenol N-acetyl-beta-D-mannosaminyltransferase
VADSAAVAVLAAVADPAAVVADSPRPGFERLNLLGVPLDTAERQEIEQCIASQVAGSNPGLLHIVTLNPEYVVQAIRLPAFRDAITRAEYSVPDGAGVVLAARVLFDRCLTRMTGVDLADWMLKTQDAGPMRVFLLGSPASVAELQGRYPVRVAGRWGSGTPEGSDDAESLTRIRESGANVVMVGYGAPAQVLWIERNREGLADAGVRVAIGLGGSLDYLAGEVPRAPELMRRLGLEWLYRLLREPWRWRRQLALPEFALMVARSRSGRAARSE